MNNREIGTQELDSASGVVRINGEHYHEVVRIAESANCTIKAVIDEAVEKLVASKRSPR